MAWQNLADVTAWAKSKGIDPDSMRVVLAADGSILRCVKAEHAEAEQARFPGSSIITLPAFAGSSSSAPQSAAGTETARRLGELHIVALNSAARAVGLSFKSGSLNKQSLIVALMEKGLGEAVLAHVGKAGAPLPAVPAPSASQIAPAPAPASAAPAVSAIEAAIREIAGQSVNETRVKEIAQQVADAAINEAIESGVLGSAAPQYLHIEVPGLPEVRFERKTHFQLPAVIRRLSLRQDVLLVGPAGSGKTTVARDAAEALSLKFYAISAVGFAHDLLGYKNASGEYVRTLFREAFEHGGIFLLDDCFGSSPDALLALNMALANSHAAFPDGMILRHPDFACVIGDNSDGSGASMQYAGRARQDGAFLDRFTNIQWQIDPDIETAMSGGNVAWLEAVRAVRAFAAGKGVQDVVATPRAVIRGAQALAAGEPARDTLRAELFRGALKDQWAQVEALHAVRLFLEAATAEF